jgi:hypothetical protein
MNEGRVAELIHELLIEIGENPEREGILKTPLRAARAWEFLTKGYHESLEDIVNYHHQRWWLGCGCPWKGARRGLRAPLHCQRQWLLTE